MSEPRDLSPAPGDAEDVAAYLAARAAISADAAMQTSILHERRYHKGCSRTWAAAAEIVREFLVPATEAPCERLRIVGGTDLDAGGEA